MRSLFLLRLAWRSMRRNGRLFAPFLLSASFMVMMEYILFYLAGSPVIVVPVGADTLSLMMRLGTFVTAVFATIFLFYTQSFLLKNRMSEFGLYHVLGMNRRDLSGLLFWQNVLCYGLSLGGGLVLGILFSKLAELAFINLIGGEVAFGFSISLEALGFTLVLFTIIFGLTWLWSLWKLHTTSTISLMQSEKQGERTPRGNLLLALAGFGGLFFAYFMALRIEDPISSLLWFFGLVLIVILSTYLVMISGSVFIVRLLRKNERLYYQSGPFISLSSISFRLKRNGAGLASICILTTMVLVTLSATASLYLGAQESVDMRYPRQINIDAVFSSFQDVEPANLQALQENLDSLLEEEGIQKENVLSWSSLYTSGLIEDGRVYLDPNEYYRTIDYSDVYYIYFLSLQQYEAMEGKSVRLEPGQALAWTNRREVLPDRLDFGSDISFEILEQLDSLEFGGQTTVSITSSIVLVIDDPLQVLTSLDTREEGRRSYFTGEWAYDFDIASGQSQSQVSRFLLNEYGKLLENGDFGLEAVDVDDRLSSQLSAFAMYGGFFFIGVLLSMVFAMAAVLIIYYKQISEGMEDQGRFEIMQQVGLNRSQIVRSIRDQLLVIFFVPLGMALLNLAFAFPIVEKLLRLFNLNNTALFFWTTAGCALAFSLFYLVVYLFTAREYYRMVQSPALS